MSERARGSASGFLIPEVLRDSQDRERLDIPLVRGFGAAKHDWQITPPRENINTALVNSPH